MKELKAWFPNALQLLGMDGKTPPPDLDDGLYQFLKAVYKQTLPYLMHFYKFETRWPAWTQKKSLADLAALLKPLILHYWSSNRVIGRLSHRRYALMYENSATISELLGFKLVPPLSQVLRLEQDFKKNLGLIDTGGGCGTAGVALPINEYIREHVRCNLAAMRELKFEGEPVIFIVVNYDAASRAYGVTHTQISFRVVNVAGLSDSTLAWLLVGLHWGNDHWENARHHLPLYGVLLDELRRIGIDGVRVIIKWVNDSISVRGMLKRSTPIGAHPVVGSLAQREDLADITALYPPTPEAVAEYLRTQAKDGSVFFCSFSVCLCLPVFSFRLFAFY